MCLFGDSLKLCTCSGQIDRNNPHWVLEKMNINKNEVDLVFIGHFPFEYFLKFDKIINDLNYNNPFDFEYQPNQKDTLSLYFETDTFHFIYTNGKWREFSEYVGLRENQKQFKQQGIICSI